MSIRLLVIDAQPVVAAGVQALLAGDGVDVVGAAASVAQAVAAAARLEPDVALLEVRLQTKDGLPEDALRCVPELRSAGPPIASLVFTASENPTHAARALALGAVGFLPKSAGRDTLLANVRRGAAGESCWTAEQRRRLTGPLTRLDGPTDRPLQGELHKPFTPRESEVLKQLALGLTNRDIAVGLGISYETVKEHVQRILRKLGVGDRTQAAVWAVRRGLC
ncbi:MAG: response regulator transcription factor [Planctomycetota bacterium]